jgi:hypothetical protein
MLRKLLARSGSRLAAEHLRIEATGALHVVRNDEVGQRDLISDQPRIPRPGRRPAEQVSHFQMTHETAVMRFLLLMRLR